MIAQAVQEGELGLTDGGVITGVQREHSLSSQPCSADGVAFQWKSASCLCLGEEVQRDQKLAQNFRKAKRRYEGNYEF